MSCQVCTWYVTLGCTGKLLTLNSHQSQLVHLSPSLKVFTLHWLWWSSVSTLWWSCVSTLWWSCVSCVFLVTFSQPFNNKYLLKVWFLTFQLWMSTEIWNFHYYLIKPIIILVLTMDNWHFVRQFNYVWISFNFSMRSFNESRADLCRVMQF